MTESMIEAEGLRNFMGQDGLAGARLALHQQWTLQCHGGIHRHFQVAAGNITFSALESGAHPRLLPAIVEKSVRRLWRSCKLNGPPRARP